MGGIQTEAERQFYLSAFGVRLWYARAHLPGAAPTPELDFSAYPPAAIPENPAPTPQPVTRQDRSKSAPAKGRSDIARIMQSSATEASSGEIGSVHQKGRSVVDAERPAVESAGTDPEVSTADVLRSLSIDWGLWWSEEICLISSITDQASYDLQSRLASNILAALNCTVKTQHRLHWPVFHNPHIPADGPARLAQILEKLGRKCSRMNRIIWLGVSVQAEESAPALRDFIGAPTIDFAHSLSALASDHHLKRALWRQLKQHELTGW